MLYEIKTISPQKIGSKMSQNYAITLIVQIKINETLAIQNTCRHNNK